MYYYIMYDLTESDPPTFAGREGEILQEERLFVLNYPGA